MTATIKLELTLDKLIEAINSLDFEEKCQIREVIEQQIFEQEEENYKDNSDTREELDLIRKEYQEGEYVTLNEFLAQS